jgi:DNA-directed RNA polymerase subunit RPC12/RpoP
MDKDNSSIPLKKVKPSPINTEGVFFYYCAQCIVEWTQKNDEPTIICPDCGKIISRSK